MLLHVVQVESFRGETVVVSPRIGPSMKRKVIVIGAGLSGTVLANGLSEDFDVLILEKGRKRGYVTPAVRYDGRRLAAVPTFCYGLGGTTNLWHNGLIPMRPLDLTPGPWRDVLSDSSRFTDQAAMHLHLSAPLFTEFHARELAQSNRHAAALGLGADEIDCLVYPKRFWPLAPVTGVRTVCEVHRLTFESTAGRVTAVNFQTGDQACRAEGDVFIVAAGALGTPGVLQDLVPQLGGDADRIGLGLIDHPMGFVGKVRFKKEFADLAADLSSSSRGSCSTQSPFRLTSACGQYTGCAFLRPATTMSNRLSVHKYKSLLGATKGLSRARNAVNVKLLHPDILAEVAAHVTGRRLPGRIYSILFIGEQKRGTNRAYFDGDQLVVDWSITESEIRAFRSMLTHLRDRLSPVADELVVNTEIESDWLWSCAHHSGTTELGDGSSAGIGPSLRLAGSRNVFVCDASVIQEHSYANTGLSIAQLACRLADHLRTNV